MLGDRYILFGEWLYAKHTIYYDQLPGYLMEYDIFDRVSHRFLSTDLRKEMLKGLSFLSSVKVVGQGLFSNADELYDLTGLSHFISPDQNENFLKSVAINKQPIDIALEQTDLTGMMEGLYIKHEENGEVLGRYKFIRQSFLNLILNQPTHWKDRPLTQNRLNTT